jgi:hypothetical protein
VGTPHGLQILVSQHDPESEICLLLTGNHGGLSLNGLCVGYQLLKSALEAPKGTPSVSAQQANEFLLISFIVGPAILHSYWTPPHFILSEKTTPLRHADSCGSVSIAVWE